MFSAITRTQNKQLTFQHGKKDTCRPTIFSEEKLADYIAILGSATDLLPKDKEYLHFLNKTAWKNTWQRTIVETCHKISCVCPTFWKKGMTAELRPSQQYWHNPTTIFKFLPESFFVICTFFFLSSGGLSPLKGRLNIDARKLEFKNDRFTNRSSLCYVGILIKGWRCHSPLAGHMILVSPVLRFNFHFCNSLLSPNPLRFQTVFFKCQLLRRQFMGNYGGAELWAHCLHY